MFNSNKILSVVILLILTMLVMTSLSFANAAEPPSIVIIVPGAPDDLEINIFPESECERANKLDKRIETYYTFYLRGSKHTSDYKFKISAASGDFEILLDEPLKTYNNIFTLNLKERTLKPGKSLSRTIKLVSVRVILTLIIEGAIFLLFGYREKKSWVYFLIINLMTQGALNIWLNGFTPLQSYLFFTLVFGEIWVFIAEMIAFSVLVKEQGRIKTIAYVLIANALSLILGGYMISMLPI